jgi:asparagine synthase (glutamine-hydrolysing)
MKLDQQYDLMSLNLCYTDRMSMAAGVEARVPFLDFKLVRMMNSIPPNLKIKGLQGKYIFKKAMEPYLPKEVIYRSKAGFGLPIRAWLRARNTLVDHYLDYDKIKKQGIFDPEGVRRVLVDHASEKKDHSYTVWTLLTQQIWLQENCHLRGSLN